MHIINNKRQKAFTLIELLVVISIIGVLVAVSIFGLSGARESSRDARRKADLELIKAGLELYKADCNSYPTSIPAAGSALVGTYPPTGAASCKTANTYIAAIPADPITSDRNYIYKVNGNGYVLCASLEQQSLATITDCGSAGLCGGSGCNYKIINP
jgi:general secretion pathway protein G